MKFKRRYACIILALAILLLMLFILLLNHHHSNNSNWLDSVFLTYDESSKNTLNNIKTVSINQSAVYDNYNITIEEMISDNNIVALLVEINTVDGSTLPEGDLTQAPDDKIKYCTDITFDGQIYASDKYGSQIHTIKISEGKDKNVAEYVLLISWNERIEDSSLVDEVNFNITSISLTLPYYSERCELIEGWQNKIICEGNWNFIFDYECNVDSSTIVGDNGENIYVSPISIYREIKDNNEKFISTPVVVTLNSNTEITMVDTVYSHVGELNGNRHATIISDYIINVEDIDLININNNEFRK